MYFIFVIQMLPSPPACTAKSEKSRSNSPGKMKGMHFYSFKTFKFPFRAEDFGFEDDAA